MPEKVCESKTLLVQQVCPRCNDGIMRYSHKSYDSINSIKVSYVHICDYCGNLEHYDTYYPIQRLIPIEPLREPTEFEKVIIKEV